MQNMGLLK